MAAARIVGEGRVVSVTAGGTVSKGDVFEGVDGVGIYLEDAVSGELVAVAIAGEVEVDKETPLVIALLDRVYWDAANDRADKTNTNIPLGLCTLAAASADTRVRVALNR